MRTLKEYTDIVYTLEKYSQQDNTFVHFSNLPKLGVNPQSSHSTPIGIYGYPIKQMFKDIENNNIPYAGDRKFVITFKATGNIVELSNYNAENLAEDKEKIKKIFVPYFNLTTVRKLTNSLPEKIKDHHIANIYHVLNSHKDIDKFRFLSSDNWIKNYILGKLDDEALGEILGADTIKRMNDIRQDFRDEQNKIRVEDFFDYFFADAHLTTKLKTYAGIFWNITRLLAKHLVTIGKGQNPAIVWTSIFRKLGYDGFTDKTGTGLIHENEPTQAVFFGANGIKLLDISNNVRSRFKNYGKYRQVDHTHIIEYNYARSAQLALAIRKKTGWDLVKCVVVDSETPEKKSNIIFNMGVKLPAHTIYLDCRGLNRANNFKMIDSRYITKELIQQYRNETNGMRTLEYDLAYSHEVKTDLQIVNHIGEIFDFHMTQKSIKSSLTDEDIEKDADTLIKIANNFLSKHPKPFMKNATL